MGAGLCVGEGERASTVYELILGEEKYLIYFKRFAGAKTVYGTVCRKTICRNPICWTWKKICRKLFGKLSPSQFGQIVPYPLIYWVRVWTSSSNKSQFSKRSHSRLDSSVLRRKSVANLLECHLRRFVKLVNNDNRFYPVDNVNDFNELMWRCRWTTTPSSYVIQTTPTYNHITPFQPVHKTKQTGSVNFYWETHSLYLTMPRKWVEKASLLCDCGASEDIAVHYFQNFKYFQRIKT